MRVYNRAGALIYAAYFHDRICHDGRVATKKGYPGSINGVRLSPGLPFSQVGAIDGEEDCTHFISCCLGQTVSKIRWGSFEVEHRGGGLRIGSPFRNHGVYGETYVPRLIGTLVALGAKIIGPQFQITAYDSTRDNILRNLTAGDVLAYASRDNPNKYEHMAMIIDTTRITCHTTFRFGEDFTDVYHPWVTLLRLPD